MRWSLSLLKVTSYLVCFLMAQRACYSSLGCISGVGMKKRRRGLQVETCMLVLLQFKLFKLCNRSFSLNVRLTDLPLNVWGCFSFGNNHREFQILSPKLVLKGKKKQVRNQKPSVPLSLRKARGRNHRMCVLFPVGGWERPSLFWLLCIHSTALYKLHLLFMHYS